MGFTYEVYYWNPDSGKDIVYYQGESLITAMWNMEELKAMGKACITLIWRP